MLRKVSPNMAPMGTKKEKTKRRSRTMLLLAIAFFLPGVPFTMAQNLDQIQKRRPNQVFSETIKTVQVQRNGINLSDPILLLNGEVTLECSFDDLSEDYKDYKYTLVHCDPWWQPTEELQREEYLESYYYEEYINDQTPSYNTITPYIHYRFSFPNENMRLRISGNYKLIVYEETPEEPAFTRGIMVSEQAIHVKGRVAKSVNPALREEVQQLFFSVETGNFHLEDPYRNLEVFVSQHGRWDNELSSLKPSLIKQNTLLFEQEGMILFKGHNEFRFLDLRSLRHLTQKVSEIDMMDRIYRAKVIDRKPARFLAYQHRDDIEGKFLIHTEEGEDPNIEADYVQVQLFLPYDRPIAGGKLYVTGDFCDWQYREENRAIYSARQGGYTLSLLLKQGYYNYTWALVEQGQLPADATFIDGTFPDTQNAYLVRVYYSDPGTYYYRLLTRHLLDSSESF